MRFLFFFILIALTTHDSAAAPPKSASTDAPHYVGLDKCRECHVKEVSLWRGSDHDLAMQDANTKTVLGDFTNVKFTNQGVTSTFFRRENKYFVNTDGADGKLHDFEIKYTFGVFPLQQYLIPFPGGRLQALGIAWDSRPSDQGGQRWFFLYPGEKISHSDELHWTGLNQNWNYMCADCHSTNLQKNYNATTNTYATTWSEIDVSCEACHGPASRHVRWAQDEHSRNNFVNKGFALNFDERKGSSWVFDLQTGMAKRSPAKHTNKEIETCAPCHSRRVTMYPDYRPGDRFLDNFQVSFLDAPLYYADGQIDGEVYVYGSFVQSKMYNAGVTCSDCHEPHSLKVRNQGNALCAQCHLPTKFDRKSHHLHAAGSEGAACVNCHMPSKNFMVIDARRDHSFRIPRPDLSIALGVPNACAQCHKDKSNEWAAGVLEEHFGKPTRANYGLALNAGRRDLPKAEALLSRLILEETQPAMARATAVTLLPNYLSQQSAPVLQMVAQSDEPLLGLALASVAEQIPPQYRPVFAVPLLYDNSRVTRGLAAQSLAGLSLEQFPQEVKEKYKSGVDDFIHSNQFNSDRPESLTNLGNYYLRLGSTDAAEKYFNKAIEMAPYFTAAYVNLSDLYRRKGDEAAGQRILLEALTHVREIAVIQHALGLSYARVHQLDTAIDYLRQAADDPDAPARYHYVYAIGLNSAGKPKEALQVLEDALAKFPNNADILSALISINHELGNEDRANYFKKLMKQN